MYAFYNTATDKFLYWIKHSTDVAWVDIEVSDDLDMLVCMGAAHLDSLFGIGPLAGCLDDIYSFLSAEDTPAVLVPAEITVDSAPYYEFDFVNSFPLVDCSYHSSDKVINA